MVPAPTIESVMEIVLVVLFTTEMPLAYGAILFAVAIRSMTYFDYSSVSKREVHCFDRTHIPTVTMPVKGD